MRCTPAHHFTVAKAQRWRSAITEDPPYQRQSDAWSLAQRQLFLDSLLNGYDVPKLYLHDLRGEHPSKVYGIVDGRQRLTAIWGYLDDAYPLADDFAVEPRNTPDVPPDAVDPVGAVRFSELDPSWQRVLLQTFLSVVLIRAATVEDIEELFARLNNGESLTAAERRNAFGGAMAGLIREVVRTPFFSDRLGFANTRMGHLDLAARLVALEAAAVEPGRIHELDDSALDAFVRDNRHLPDSERRRLKLRVEERLARLVGSSPGDPVLASPGEALRAYAAAWTPEP